MSKFIELMGDIDIDTGDRRRLLDGIPHVPAAVVRGGRVSNHNTGVYFHSVPRNPFSETCSLNYEDAEKKGCYKIDLLNNHIYDRVRNETHLTNLISTPPMWELLTYPEVIGELAHINNHVELVLDLRPQSTIELAMLLALIRPGKRHLVRRCQAQGWKSLEPEIWAPDPNQNYTFKKSHAVSLSVAIQVQLNLLVETTADSCYNISS